MIKEGCILKKKYIYYKIMVGLIKILHSSIFLLEGPSTEKDAVRYLYSHDTHSFISGF